MGEDLLRELSRLEQLGRDIGELGLRIGQRASGSYFYQAVGANNVLRFIGELDVIARIRESIAPNVEDTVHGLLRTVTAFAPKIIEDIAPEARPTDAVDARIFVRRDTERLRPDDSSPKEYISTPRLPLRSLADIMATIARLSYGAETEVRIVYYRRGQG